VTGIHTGREADTSVQAGNPEKILKKLSGRCGIRTRFLAKGGDQLFRFFLH